MIDDRPTKVQWALTLARETAKRSTCLRRSVGCVLVDAHGHVLATGYNGVHSGAHHCNERVELADGFVMHPHACKGSASQSGTDLDRCQAIHAEQNALLQCTDVSKIMVAAVTTAPCVTCTKLLLNTGCQVIAFTEDYPQSGASSELWLKAGRQWLRLEP